DPARPGVDGMGLVEPADVLDVSPECVEGCGRFELGEDHLRPVLRREGRDGPGRRTVLDRLEDLGKAGEAVAGRPPWVDAGQESGRNHRRENDPGRLELPQVEY